MNAAVKPALAAMVVMTLPLATTLGFPAGLLATPLGAARFFAARMPATVMAVVVVVGQQWSLRLGAEAGEAWPGVGWCLGWRCVRGGLRQWLGKGGLHLRCGRGGCDPPQQGSEQQGAAIEFHGSGTSLIGRYRWPVSRLRP